MQQISQLIGTRRFERPALLVEGIFPSTAGHFCIIHRVQIAHKVEVPQTCPCLPGLHLYVAYLAVSMIEGKQGEPLMRFENLQHPKKALQTRNNHTVHLKD
jgi:hypothetical protein